MDNGASSYRRFLAGDEDGMVEIIRDYKDGLMLYLNRYVQNIHVAEDLTEDTFVKIVVKRPRYSQKSSFKTWLYAIGRNIAIDYLRKSGNSSALSLDEAAVLLADEESVERTYIKGEQNLILHRALKRLAPDYQRVLYLLYFEEMEHSQIATVLHKSNRQISNLVYRAKLSLKTELEKEDFVYEELS